MISGAAQITLIHDDKLIELLKVHEIDMRKQTVELLEVDHEFFDAQVEAGVGDEIEI